MPTYAWSAKDKSGAVVFREINAATVQESRDVLLEQGYTDLALKEDDIIAETVVSMGEKAEFLGEEIKVSASDRVAHRNQPPLTITGMILEALKKDTSYFVIIGLCLAFWIYRHSLVGTVICASLLIGWPLFRIGIGMPLLLYQRLADASDWNRWDEMLRLVKQLRAVRRFHFIKVPETELARFEAKALAGKGRLAEAEPLYRRVENQPGLPSWLFKSHLAGIYQAAGDQAGALRLTREALALKPDNTLHIDLANRLARYHADPAGAREALKNVDSQLVVDLAKPFLIRLLGIIAWLENDFETAKRELETAIREMEKTRHVPFRTGNIAVAKGYLCCVNGKLGNHQAARKCYAEAQKYLVATKETQLLQDCQEAVGRH